MGDKPVIVCAAINNPMVMHEFEHEADGIVVEFGVSRAAVLDIVFGDYDPPASACADAEGHGHRGKALRRRSV